MTHELPDLDCERHPDMLAILTIDQGGKVHWHSHCDKGAFVAMLGSVVDQMRAELLTEAA